jgi:hypothetical protein
MPHYGQLEGLIQTIDKLWLDHEDANFMFFDEIHDQEVADEKMTEVTIEKMVEKINSKLPEEAKLESKEVASQILSEKEITFKESLIDITDIVIKKIKSHVKVLGSHQSNIILACLYKYFIEQAEENREYYRQRTILVKPSIDLVVKAQAMASALIGSEIDMSPVIKYLEPLEKELEVEESNLKSVDPNSLYRLFISRVQK